jgi:hypothetical protein
MDQVFTDQEQTLSKKSAKLRKHQQTISKHQPKISKTSAKHQQQIALTGGTLAAAAPASARHQCMLLTFALVLNCTGWRSTLTRCSALGQPIAPADVTLAVTAASAEQCVRHRSCVSFA